MNTLYYNGQYCPKDAPFLPHIDCGVTTSIGIFDSMLSFEGVPLNSELHYNRLIHDAEIVIGLTPDVSFASWNTIITKLMTDNNCLHGYARIRTTITGGIVSTPLAKATSPSCWIDVSACTEPVQTPVTCAIITDFPRIAGCVLENCKRLDYSRSYAARRAAEKMGAQDAILTNTAGNIACATTSNLFIEENGALITPPLSDGVLAGITRYKLIEQGKAKERNISIEQLKNADAIYSANSFTGLRKVILV